MKKNLSILFTLLPVFILCGCLEMDNKYEKLPPGPWRGVLYLDSRKQVEKTRAKEFEAGDRLNLEAVPEGELPFNFEVAYVDDSSMVITIRNAEEHIRIDSIDFGEDAATLRDTLLIHFPHYDTYIKALHEGDVIEGEWLVRRKENYRIPFVAHYGEDHRFTTVRDEPFADLTGTWAVTFEIESDDPYPAIGEFRQEGNYLEGTFRTETGDYRYLEGTVIGNKMYLSAFDGAHAFLFEALITEDTTLSGIFRSGSHYLAQWEGRRDTSLQLADPFKMSQATAPSDPVEFTFPNPDGEMISIDDPQFAGKPKIIQIMGTWCPNCYDETEFLKQFIEDNPELDIAVIGLAFEYYREQEKSLAAIERYTKTLQVPYPILLGGMAGKDAASEALPMIDKIISYPTTLFLDRKNRIVAIHTGFNGPATSKFEEFKEKFQTAVEQIQS